MGFDYCQKLEVQKNEAEIFSCPILNFYSGSRRSSAKVEFKFKDKTEFLYMDRSTIRTYRDLNPKDYVLYVTATQGVWNHYTVEKYQIEHKTGD